MRPAAQGVLVPWGGQPGSPYAGFEFWCQGREEYHLVNTMNEPGHPVWGFNGDFDKPTFTPSVLVRSGHYTESSAAKRGECWCNFNERFPDQAQTRFKCQQCHSFVTDGMIQYLGDSSHALAGQTVVLIRGPE